MSQLSPYPSRGLNINPNPNPLKTAFFKKRYTMAMGLLSKTTTLLVHRIVFGHFFSVPVGLRRENT